MEFEYFFAIPPGVFFLITVYCYFKMIGIATNHRYDSVPFFNRVNFDDLRDIDKFKTITHNLTDKKKQKRYNRIYYAFIICLILMFASFGLPLIVLLLMGEI